MELQTQQPPGTHFFSLTFGFDKEAIRECGQTPKTDGKNYSSEVILLFETRRNIPAEQNARGHNGC